MNAVREPILGALQALDIRYELFEHPPVHTADEAAIVTQYQALHAVCA